MPSLCGSSCCSCCWTKVTSTWYAGRQQTESSSSSNRRKWRSCGGCARTRPTWTTTSWAEPCATTMTRWFKLTVVIVQELPLCNAQLVYSLCCWKYHNRFIVVPLSKPTISPDSHFHFLFLIRCTVHIRLWRSAHTVVSAKYFSSSAR